MPAAPTKTFLTADVRQVTFLTTVKNKIPYIEFLERQKSFAQDAISSTRYLGCLWAQQATFLSDILGTSNHEPTSVGGIATNITRQVPETDPEHDWLYAQEAKLVEPMGLPVTEQGPIDNLALELTSNINWSTVSSQDRHTNAVKFSLAKFAVTYTPRDYDIMEDFDVPNNSLGELNRYVSIYHKPSADNQIIPGGAFRFVSDGFYVNEPPAKTFPLLELHYAWHQVPTVPIAAIQDAVGKCNNALFHSYWPAETLICMPPDLKRIRTAYGDIAWEITYFFVYRPGTWNALYRRQVPVGGGPGTPGNPGFDRIISTVGNEKLTLAYDFNNLFKLPAP